METVSKLQPSNDRDATWSPFTRSVLQVHVTERCNLHCEHCYQNPDIPSEMALEELIHLADEFESLCCDQTWAGQINFTGGEPFIRSDFMALLEKLTTRERLTTFAILTNGTLIDSSLAVKLASLRPQFVQISIEGGQATHDAIRGQGSYVRAAEALIRLRRAGVTTLISFTAHRGNYLDFPAVVELADETQASALWADRMVPMGRGSTLETLLPNEASELFLMIEMSRRELHASGSATQIHLRRALQFLVGGGRPYRCSAGKTLLAVMPDGVVYPCRRLPISLGNVRAKPLEEFYKLRNVTSELPDGCAPCPFGPSCHGGSRCVAHAVFGNMLQPDPGCWLPARIHSTPG